MSTITQPAPKRKPVQRTVRLAEPALDWLNDGRAKIVIDQGREVFEYRIKEIPCELGGRGFEVLRTLAHNLRKGTWDWTQETYHVRISANPAECSCDCKGFTYHRKCKHIFATLALEQAGKL